MWQICKHWDEQGWNNVFQVFQGHKHTMLSPLWKRFINKNTKQFPVKKSSRIVKAYQFKMICIILNKASVTIEALAQKMKIWVVLYFVG